jgi:PKD repeat protein
MLLVTLFVFSTIAILGIPEVNPDFPSDKPTLWVDEYEFFDAANLTSTNFNITVNIFNVTNMRGCEIKLGYNATLLHAVRVYPTDITDDASKWLPLDEFGVFHWDDHPTINNTRLYAPDYAYVWVAAWDFTIFTGSGAVFTIEFHIEMAPPRESVIAPENKSVSSVLDLFDTEVLDVWADPIAHYVDDGLYLYTRPQMVIAPPVAEFTWTPTVPATNETVTFNASASTPNGGIITSYAWDFDGDGVVDKTVNETITTWQYDAVGSYNVTLNVTDSEGEWDTVTHVVEVVKGPRVPLFVYPSVNTVEFNETFTIGIIINNVVDLYSFEFKLGYNTTILDVTAVWVMWPDFYVVNETAGVVWVNASSPFPYPFSGNGTLATITFKGMEMGSSVLDLYDTMLIDFYAAPITHGAVDGYAVVIVHDVAIVNIAPSTPEVYPSCDIDIIVTVKNEGNIKETFWVAVYFNRTATEWVLIGNQTVTDLDGGREKLVTFVLKTEGLSPIIEDGEYGIYTFNATISVLPREFDTEDNVLVDGALGLRFLGDVNGDGVVSLIDIGKLDLIYSRIIPPPRYPPYMPDINCDGLVGLVDIARLDLIYSGMLP